MIKKKEGEAEDRRGPRGGGEAGGSQSGVHQKMKAYMVYMRGMAGQEGKAIRETRLG